MAVRWFDNRKVDMISSFVGVKPFTRVNRYDRKEKKVVGVDCPAVICSYTKNMGGVDLLDSLTALYKAKIKSRHWYLYIFFSYSQHDGRHFLAALPEAQKSTEHSQNHETE